MSLRGEAIRHAVWLKNRTPMKALEGTETASGCYLERPEPLHDPGMGLCSLGAQQCRVQTEPPAREGWMGPALTMPPKTAVSIGPMNAPHVTVE